MKRIPSDKRKCSYFTVKRKIDLRGSGPSMTRRGFLWGIVALPWLLASKRIVRTSKHRLYGEGKHLAG